MPEKKLVALTGAGISAESGLNTFRDSGGLWEGYDIYEVASPQGWRANRETVLDFYNLRREQAASAIPNQAHLTLKELEASFDVHIITQNVDDLHEKAGSSKVLHLHGELTKAKSEADHSLVVDIGYDPIKPGDTAPDGAQLRPDVVWFGEAVPNIEPAAEIMSDADLVLVIGTSLMVYPAAGLIHYAENSVPGFIVDPSPIEAALPAGWKHIQQKAGIGLPELAGELIQIF